MSSEARDSWSGLLAALTVDAGRARTVIPGSWGQGRSCFGGVLAALALEPMRERLAAHLSEQGSEGEGRRQLRSLQVAFIGPVASEVEVEVEAELLRHGRSASTLAAKLVQAGEPRVQLTACFAADRESRVELSGAPRPELAGPEGLGALPYVEGLTPAFTRHLELRWAIGGAPGSRLEHSNAAGWVRFRQPQSCPVSTSILALVDAWPAPTLQMLDGFALASSLTWTLDFVDDAPAARAEDWWAFAVDTDRASGGWVHTSARLWAPSGELVALSRQTVAMFA